MLASRRPARAHRKRVRRALATFLTFPALGGAFRSVSQFSSWLESFVCKSNQNHFSPAHPPSPGGARSALRRANGLKS